MAYDEGASFFLRMRGPLRVGNHADDLSRSQPYPSSDTLYGALVWAYEHLRGADDAAQWVAQFAAGKPPFLISSAMPATEVVMTIVPRPVRRPGLDEGALPERKFLQAADFIDAKLLPWLAGRTGRPLPTVRARALVGEDWPEDADCTMHERPRVTIDRGGSASAIYRAASMTFKGDAGIAMHALAQSASEIDLLDRLLRLLGECGIGGERSLGYGQFDVSRRPLALPVSPDPEGPLLSLLWPRPEEVTAGALMAEDGTGYRLIDRTGWIASVPWMSHRGKTVTMIGEGSYVSPRLRQPVGGMADVTPDVPLQGRHRVFRYGFGLFLREEALAS